MAEPARRSHELAKACGRTKRGHHLAAVPGLVFLRRRSRSLRARPKGDRDAVAGERVDESGCAARLQYSCAVHWTRFAEEQRSGRDRLHQRPPVTAALPELAIPREDLVERAGDIR